MTLGIAQQQQDQGGADRDAAIIAPPVLFPLRGGTLGSHVLYTTAYEHLHVLQPGVMERPSSSSSSSSKSNKHHSSTTTSTSTTSTHSSFKELLVEPPTFPLLLESSAYLTSPVLHDANADGLLDAMVVDYDGGLSLLGISTPHSGGGASSSSSLYRHHGQVPRMFLRREWMEHGFSLQSNSEQQEEDTTSTGNATTNNSKSNLHDPFHSYFEYYYENAQAKDLIRGESAIMFGQSSDCLLYTSPSPRDLSTSRMPSSA